MDNCSEVLVKTLQSPAKVVLNIADFVGVFSLLPETIEIIMVVENRHFEQDNLLSPPRLYNQSPVMILSELRQFKTRSRLLMILPDSIRTPQDSTETS